MSKEKPSASGKRLVWRIDVEHPLGAFVDPDEARKPVRREAADPGAVHSGWMMSSYDLRDGTEVTEGGDTVPDDLFDELFPATIVSAARPPEAI